jgi:2-epi-valiolone-7-phosphate 1-reductase
MPRVPEHSIATRVSSQRGLTLKRQTPDILNDSLIFLKMLSAGVCGTDLAMLSGARASQAEILGHEGVAAVISAPASCNLAEGARLIINPVHRKLPHRVIGHSHDGVFREYFWLDAREAREGNLLVSCPHDCWLSNAELVFAEPLGSVLYSLELLREKCAAGLLVIRGSGTIGILAAKLWSLLTGSPAILISKSETHAEWLRRSTRWPAAIRICSCATVHDVLHECSGALEPRAAILCCSREDAAEGLRLLLDIVEEGATIDLMAGFPGGYKEQRLDDVALDDIRWQNICGDRSSPPKAVVDSCAGKKLFLTGHRGTADRHILEAIELLSRRVITLADVPHRVFSLEQLPFAVNQMLSRHVRPCKEWVKAIVVFSEGNG